MSSPMIVGTVWALLVCASYGFQFGRQLPALHHRLFATTSSISKSNEAKEYIPYDPDLWRKGYADCKEEVCEMLNGTLPKDLVGTYYRNVHGKYKVGRDEIMHPFDADGMIAAFTFQNGSCFFRNRFVRTNGFLRERKQKRILYRGAFGTQIPGGPLANFLQTSLKNVANTNIIFFANRLLALWESGTPYRLEEDSLRTIGKYTFRGILKENEPFTAHPKVDPVTGNLVGFNYQPSVDKTKLRIMEIDPQLSLKQDKTVNIPGFSFFHDMAITKSYNLFIQGAFEFNPFPFVFGLKSPAACMTFQKDGKAKVHILSRDSSKPDRVIELDNHFNFHIANAFEQDNGDIVLDVVGGDDMLVVNKNQPNVPIWQSFQWHELPRAQVHRYILHVQSNSFTKQPLFPFQFEMPVVPAHLTGTDVQYIYGISNTEENKPGPFQSLVKIHTKTSSFTKFNLPSDEFIGEPVFAPKSTASLPSSNTPASEDDGYILVMTLNPRTMTSYLLIFDAKTIEQGPMQRLELPTYVSYGLHGNYVPNLTFDFPDVKRKFTAFSALDKQNWNEIKGGFSGLGIVYDFQ